MSSNLRIDRIFGPLLITARTNLRSDRSHTYVVRFLAFSVRASQSRMIMSRERLPTLLAK